MDIEPRIVELLVKHIRYDLSVEEGIELDAWRSLSSGNDRFMSERMDPEQVMEKIGELVNYDPARIRRKMELQMDTRPPRARRKLFRPGQTKLICAGVAVLATVIITALVRQRSSPQKDGAHLILPNGRIINAEEMAIGESIDLDGCQVSKTGERRLNYSMSGTDDSNNAVLTHVLSVPYGQSWELTLADWVLIQLSPGSSISYPTGIAQGVVTQRNLHLEGEGVFQVTGSNGPLMISTERGTVMVLNGSFYIRDYSKEFRMRVCPINGFLYFSNGRIWTKLTPGREVSLDRAGGRMMVRQTDTLSHMSI